MAGTPETAPPHWRTSLAREHMFLAACALLFAAGAGGTVAWCGSECCAGTPMPGGWTMSMTWMRLPGQSRLGAAASFLGMWVVMMLPMMLPALVPMLLSYRRAIRPRSETDLNRLTAVAGAGYFFVWAIIGTAVYPLGVIVANAAIQSAGLSRFVPLATGVVLMLVGILQFTTWKARQLGCCRNAATCTRSLSGDVRSAWRYGLSLGMHCSLCCSGFMIMLLAIGVMDLAGMAIVTVAITAERLAPKPECAARVAGAVVVAVGAFVIVRVLGAV